MKEIGQLNAMCDSGTEKKATGGETGESKIKPIV